VSALGITILLAGACTALPAGTALAIYLFRCVRALTARAPAPARGGALLTDLVVLTLVTGLGVGLILLAFRMP
jgi:hypothetical protein